MLCKVPSFLKHDVIVHVAFTWGKMNEHVHNIHLPWIDPHTLGQSMTILDCLEIWTVVGSPNQCQSPGSCEASMTTPSHLAIYICNAKNWSLGRWDSRLGHPSFLAAPATFNVADQWILVDSAQVQFSNLPNPGLGNGFFQLFRYDLPARGDCCMLM